MKRPTRARLVLAVAAPLLAGCGLSPAGTTVPYDPSDGVSASLGSVQVRNLLVVGSDAEQPGVVSGVLLNSSTEPVTVTFATEGGEPIPVEVPGDGSVQLGATAGDPTSSPGTKAASAAVVQFASMPKPAGAVVPITMSSPDGGTTVIQTPVLAATLEYASITPTGVPAPTGTETGEVPAGETPIPSPTDLGADPSQEPSSAVTSNPVDEEPTPTSAPTGTASAESTAAPSG